MRFIDTDDKLNWPAIRLEIVKVIAELEKISPLLVSSQHIYTETGLKICKDGLQLCKDLQKYDNWPAIRLEIVKVIAELEKISALLVSSQHIYTETGLKICKDGLQLCKDLQKYDKQLVGHDDDNKQPAVHDDDDKKPAGHDDKQPEGHDDDKQPAGHDDKQPAAHDDKQPAAHDDKQPAGHDDKQPAGHDDKQPAAHDDKQPAVHDDDKKPAVHDDDDKQPAVHGDDDKQQTVHGDDKQLAAHDDKQPAGHDDKQPAGHDDDAQSQALLKRLEELIVEMNAMEINISHAVNSTIISSPGPYLMQGQLNQSQGGGTLKSAIENSYLKVKDSLPVFLPELLHFL